MFGLFVFIFILMLLTDRRSDARAFLRMVISFYVVVWCIRILVHVGFALLPCIVIFLVLGKVVLPFLKGFFSRF